MSRTSDGLKRHPSQWGVADAQPSRSHAVFLRAVAHVPIQPFRDGLEELGLRDVTSFGATGNLMFNTDVEDMRLLEEAITGRLGAVAFVRTREQLAEIVAADPYGNEPGAAVALLADPVPSAHRKQVETLEFTGPPPVLIGTTVYFAEATRLRGKGGTLSPEYLYGVAGTVRATSVMAKVLARM